MDQPKIYFEKESPDFNFGIEDGNEKKVAANRCVLCIFTEFGICNDRRMLIREYNRFIINTQAVGIVTE